MRNVIFIFLLGMILGSCDLFIKKEKSYPIYDITPEERKWIFYKLGDTLTFKDVKKNTISHWKVTDQKEYFREFPIGKDIAYKEFYSYATLDPLKGGEFNNKFIQMYYLKTKEGFNLAMTIHLGDGISFRNQALLSNIRVVDTLIENVAFKNGLLFLNERGYSDFKHVLYTKEKGIVAILNENSILFKEEK